jgi:hypothetical protein
MSELVFEAPPGKGSRSRNGFCLSAIAMALCARPGEWAKVDIYSKEHRAYGYTKACNIRKGRYQAFPSGKFDAVARTLPDGTVAVFARFIGDAK